MGNNGKYLELIKHPNYVRAVEETRLRQLQKGVDSIRKYDKSPKRCKFCKKTIEYRKRFNSFCSKSCSTSYNNILRGPRTPETKAKIGRTNTRGVKPKPKRFCKRCGEVEMVKTKKTICNRCKKRYYEYYLPSCKFIFDIKLYPDVFDLSLVEEYGWYSPSNKKNNLKGVSKDHKFSIRDGFLNKIDPELIRHPANCELMLHEDNQRKNRKSSITFEKLLSLIDNWAYDREI